jgi:hypothetical protein
MTSEGWGWGWATPGWGLCRVSSSAPHLSAPLWVTQSSWVPSNGWNSSPSRSLMEMEQKDSPPLNAVGSLHPTRVHDILAGHGEWQRWQREGLIRGHGISAWLETHHVVRKEFLEDEVVRTWKMRGSGAPFGSTDPIWAPLGLSFGLRDLAGLRLAGLGAPPILRSEAYEHIITFISINFG